MLNGNMACPRDSFKRKKWAEQEATLQAVVREDLVSKKTKQITLTKL